MGFDVDKFVCNVEDEKKCKLCLGVLDNPVRTPCGHVFCSGCILPWVVRHGCCPKKCTSEDLSPADLEVVLPLRQLILDMQVKCEFADRGCQSVVPLTVLIPHSQDCAYRPVCCRNPGCSQTVNLGHLVTHETDDCEWRPVGICQLGCGLVLLQRAVTTGHECVDALKNQIGEQEIRTGSLETEMRRLQSRFVKKEKSLLAQIATLHGDVQQQALKFQLKLNNYRQQLYNISLLYNNNNNNNNNISIHNNNYNNNDYNIVDNNDDDDGGGGDRNNHVDKKRQDPRVTIVLEREEGTLGFNIMGGYNPEKSNDNVSEEIIISRVTEGGAADKKGLKLHDQILKVNGQDLSQSTHEEAVEAFRTAKEPIVVEVLRRGSKTKMKSRSPTMVSVGTQTEEEIFSHNGSPPTPPPGFYAYNGTGLYQPASRRPVAFSPSADMGLTDIEMAHAYEFEDPYYDDDRAYEMECEEVILHRNANEKLGLTLCYGSLDDDMTDIFIGEVEIESIAAKDGRIRPGDQILQINGIELHSRNQAIQLFTETTSDICLLVARPQIQLDDGFMEEQNIVLDDILEERHHGKIQFMAGMLNQVHMDEEGATTDTGTTENSSHKLEKDSGVGRTDESTKNEESSEQENYDVDSLQYEQVADLHKSHESFTSNEQDFNGHDIPADVCDRFREVLEDRCASPKKDRGRKESQGSIDRELAMLNKEMEEIQMECQELVRAHMREQQKIQLQQRDMLRTEPHKSPRIVPRMGTRLEYIKHSGLTPHEQAELIRKEVSHPPKLIPQTMKFSDKEKDPATTSAYNTGESCRSTPLTLELNQMSDDSEKGLRNSMLCLVPPGNRTSGSDTEKQTQTPTKPHEHSSDESLKYKKSLSARGAGGSANLKSCESMGESLQDLYLRYSDVMYTNHANLEHTIAIQQKLFQQQLDQKSRIKGQVGGGSRGPDGRQAGAGAGAQSSDGCQMEWVVKRRPDGTRYITRRPIRNKMLKERAKKISEERAGMTTDDEAMSELKVGRYWPKEERKKHIEKARDQKRKKELMMKAKMETLKEEDKKEVNILELSHRKMMKHKGKKVLDDFVTVQEMLAHGSRVADGKSYNPLLSVTTV